MAQGRSLFDPATFRAVSAGGTTTKEDQKKFGAESAAISRAARMLWSEAENNNLVSHLDPEDPLQGYVSNAVREIVNNAIKDRTGSGASKEAQDTWLMGLTRGETIDSIVNRIKRGPLGTIQVAGMDYAFADPAANTGTNNAGTNNAGTNSAGTNNAGTAGSGNTNFGYGTSGVVYGPDGRSYSSAAAAIAAGETNYTFAPPTQGLIINQLLNNRRT